MILFGKNSVLGVARCPRRRSRRNIGVARIHRPLFQAEVETRATFDVDQAAIVRSGEEPVTGNPMVGSRGVIQIEVNGSEGQAPEVRIATEDSGVHRGKGRNRIKGVDSAVFDRVQLSQPAGLEMIRQSLRFRLF